jgi:hypothetical protein
MQIDFLNTYVPNTLELSNSDVRQVRQQLSNYTELAFPDIANNPGAVIGDLIVTP